MTSFTYDHHPAVTRRIEEISAVLEQINIWMSDNQDDIALEEEEGLEPSDHVVDETAALKTAQRAVSKLLHLYVRHTPNCDT